MKINSIGLSVPSRRFNNEQIVSLLKDRIGPQSKIDVDKYFQIVLRLLEQAGARYRHLRDIECNETAYEHILNAAHEALASAHLPPNEIDLVIYCGVGKGLLEPSNAYYYASELGISTAECFDVTDACMSWARSLEIAQMYLLSGRAKRVLVLTGEFHLNIRDAHKIDSLNSLRYNFPTYTIGEAATATIVEPSPHSWNFQFVSRPNHFDLCTIPISGYQSYLKPNSRIGLNGEGRFVSFGKELFSAATPLLRNLVETSGPNIDHIDLYIPHAPSITAYASTANIIGIPSNKLFFEIFENYGNIVSSSIPAAIYEALRLGRITDGSNLCLVPASAGISCACIHFTL